MKSIIFCVLILFMQKAVCGDQGNCENVLLKAQEWYEWGEYDSIQRLVPACLSDSVTALAKYNFYLGVASYVSDSIQDSRNYFIQAFRDNPDLDIDPNYITTEIIEFYKSTIADYKEVERERAIRDSLARQHAAQSVLNKRTLDSIAQKEIKKQKQRLVVGIALSSTFALGTGIAGILEYRNGNKAYVQYQHAAADGNLEKYNELRAETMKHDRVVLISLLATTVSSALTAYFINLLFQNSGNDKGQ